MRKRLYTYLGSSSRSSSGRISVSSGAGALPQPYPKPTVSRALLTLKSAPRKAEYRSSVLSDRSARSTSSVNPEASVAKEA